MKITIEINRIVDIDLMNELIEKLELKKINFSDKIIKLIEEIQDLEFDDYLKEYYCSECGKESGFDTQYCKYCEEKTKTKSPNYEQIYRTTLDKLEFFLMCCMENENGTLYKPKKTQNIAKDEVKNSKDKVENSKDEVENPKDKVENSKDEVENSKDTEKMRLKTQKMRLKSQKIPKR